MQYFCWSDAPCEQAEQKQDHLTRQEKNRAATLKSKNEKNVLLEIKFSVKSKAKEHRTKHKARPGGQTGRTFTRSKSREDIKTEEEIISLKQSQQRADASQKEIQMRSKAHSDTVETTKEADFHMRNLKCATVEEKLLKQNGWEKNEP